MLSTLTTKEQFDSLSKEDQMKVLFFLEDDFTEDLVWIRLEGNNLFGMLDATSCEAAEYRGVKFVIRESLLNLIKVS